jgi:hypothetical protein
LENHFKALKEEKQKAKVALLNQLQLQTKQIGQQALNTSPNGTNRFSAPLPAASFASFCAPISVVTQLPYQPLQQFNSNNCQYFNPSFEINNRLCPGFNQMSLHFSNSLYN